MKFYGRQFEQLDLIIFLLVTHMYTLAFSGFLFIQWFMVVNKDICFELTIIRMITYDKQGVEFA